MAESGAAVSLRANEAEFDFLLDGQPESALSVISFSASETVSEGYCLDVVLAAAESLELAPASTLGAPALLRIHTGDGSIRFLHGIVTRLRRWDEGQGERTRRYALTVSPRLERLKYVQRCRIFQELSTPDIVGRVLKEGGVDFRMDLQGTYPARDYCVQYRESDYAFVCRLLEEEGITFFFEHSESGHVLVCTDGVSGHPTIEGMTAVPFREGTGMAAAQEYVREAALERSVGAGAVALRDYSFLTPSVDLTSRVTLDGGDEALEIYDFPGRFEEPGGARARSRVLLEALRAQSERLIGQSTCRRFVPGARFTLEAHPSFELNEEYLLLGVHHEGESRDFVPDTSSKRSTYRNGFEALPARVPFRPSQKTPKPVIPGAQTARVVGPAGEEIHTDAHGRIKVRFHWDREAAGDDRSSCWIRVSQMWAGPGWGALYLPRVGHEVVVEFLEGDPDRPLVTGSVYNAENLPPLDLPAEKTRSTLKSASTPGGGGANELRFEDSAGAEEVYLHAQRDLLVSVEHDELRKVGRNETLDVGGERVRKVGGNQSLEVGGDDSRVIRGNESLEVAGDALVEVRGSHTETIAGSQSRSVGMTQSLTVGAASLENVGGAKTLTVAGAYEVAVGGALIETVGGSRAESVMGGKTESVGGNKTESIGGARSLHVGGALSETVGKARTLKVEKDVTVNVGGKLGQQVKDTYALTAKEIALYAEESFSLTVGSATFEVKKSGEVVLKGGKLQVQASGELVLKASKITQN